ncbi:MAG: hypothetical protein AVDCRST_MAG12-51, partial [uncultured Rubrobacteraceae bacterium]
EPMPDTGGAHVLPLAALLLLASAGIVSFAIRRT